MDTRTQSVTMTTTSHSDVDARSKSNLACKRLSKPCDPDLRAASPLALRPLGKRSQFPEALPRAVVSRFSFKSHVRYHDLRDLVLSPFHHGAASDRRHTDLSSSIPLRDRPQSQDRFPGLQFRSARAATGSAEECHYWSAIISRSGCRFRRRRSFLRPAALCTLSWSRDSLILSISICRRSDLTLVLRC